MENEFTLPPWVPVEAWDGWVEMRRANRWKLTDRAKRLAVTQLEIWREDGHDPEGVLDQSTFNCWRGLFPIQDHETRSANVQRQPGERRESAVERRRRISEETLTKVFGSAAENDE